MRTLHLYLDNTDVDLLRAWLNAEKSIAFIVPDGPERFKAAWTVEHLNEGLHWLWNVDAGPLPLVRRERDRDGVVEDPWSGWQPEVYAPDGTDPWFGVFWPVTYQLELSSAAWSEGAPPLARNEDPHDRHFYPRSVQSLNAISGFYWCLSSFDAPAKAASAWWARLGRWVRKHGQSLRDDEMNVWALPGAWKRAEREVEAWSVLWTDQARYCLVEGISGALNIYDREQLSFVHLSHDAISVLVVARMKERGVPVHRERPGL